MILHLRVVPGFWLAVEACTRPELHTHPAVVGGLPHQRGTVQEVNFPAHDLGLRPGMTLAQAQQYCPDALFLVPDPPRYDAAWEEMQAVLRGITPLVEPVAPGEAVCDLSGCERHWPDAWQAAAALGGQIHAGTGITPWFGVATNRLVAQLASARAGATGIAVVDAGQEAAFLAGLPLTTLPGVDARLALTFQVLGLRTIGQLAALPRSAVKGRFAAAGERLHDYARGIDPRPVIPPVTRPMISARRDCEDGTIDEALIILHRLAEECAAELTRRSLAATVVTVKLIRRDSAPVREPRRLAAQPPGALPAPTADRTDEDAATAFPIPYRIHSMLPQPGTNEHSSPIPAVAQASDACDGPQAVIPVTLGTRSLNGNRLRDRANGDGNHVDGQGDDALRRIAGVGSLRYGSAELHSVSPLLTARAIVRTPITSLEPLFERARTLLLKLWSESAGLPVPCSIELDAAEFAQPAQLSFPELNRLGWGASPGLAGMDPGRRQALLQSEEMLAARYGDASFRHLAYFDPAGILAERRFRWATGLPGEPTRSRPRRTP